MPEELPRKGNLENGEFELTLFNIILYNVTKKVTSIGSAEEMWY